MEGDIFCPFHWRRLWETNPTFLCTVEKTTMNLLQKNLIGEILPFSSNLTLEQRLLSLEQLLKDQQESHQQQLASFLATNATLCEENAALRNTASTPHLGNLAVPCNLARSKSTDNLSPPPCLDHPPCQQTPIEQISLPTEKPRPYTVLSPLFLPSCTRMLRRTSSYQNSKCMMVLKIPLTILCISARS